MHKLMRYIKGYEKQALLAPLFKMLEACFELFVPLVIASIIDTGIKNEDAAFIWTRCGLLVLLAAIGLASSLTAQWFSAKAALGFGTALRKDLFRHIGTLSYSELDGIGTPTLVTRMTSDINQVQSGLNLFLRLFLRSPFIVFGSIVMAFIVSPKAAVIFVVTIPLLSIVVFGIMLITMPLYRKVQGSLDGILGITRENLTGVRVIRAFGREEQEKDRFEEDNGLLVRSQLLVGKISALMNPLTYVMINLAVVVILNTGAVQIHLGNMQQGDVVALVNYMNQILIELVKLANLIIQVFVNELGTDTVAAWGTFAKIDAVYWMVVNAFGISITTFVGQNFGAGKVRRMRKSVGVCMVMAYAGALLVSGVLYALAGPLYRLFTTDEGVVRIGVDMMHFLLPSYFMYVVIGILSGALRGAGRVLVPMLLTCGGVCMIRIIWMFGVFPTHSGINTIMLSYPVSWGITAVLFIIYYFMKFPKKESQI